MTDRSAKSDKMPVVGTQLQHVADVFHAHRQPLDAGGDEDETDKKLRLAQEYSRVVMQIIVSLLILFGGFILLCFSSDDTLRKPAFGVIGVVVGYWLR
ncbi:hypothetical protein [Fuerstiella marisgermanici]|uniref:Uncharacterized protein n=1 Tax=Fuerstiella marisgermanici TaxID=1891926 RepID=A0A1P8WC15_9PLAN|nr:hypothetical protein [Fuerstiella marisgermanici]APZ91605.1 hypothetical protein Fuma_01194 [Fuerstiella marisgermanici]